MIDISDGLSRDLRHICRESGVGATHRAPARFPSTPTPTCSRADGRYPLEHALHDGEDYELLFTTSEEQPFGYWIGTITADTAVIDEDRVGLAGAQGVGAQAVVYSSPGTPGRWQGELRMLHVNRRSNRRMDD